MTENIELPSPWTPRNCMEKLHSNLLTNVYTILQGLL